MRENRCVLEEHRIGRARKKMKHWRARHIPRDTDPNPPTGGDAATVAGDAGPGFHTWPSGHILQDTASNPLLRIPKNRSEKRSAPRARSAPPATEEQKKLHPNPPTGGDAATVAGDAGPGFHTWPSGHILQDTASNPLLRIPKKMVRRNVPRRNRGQRPRSYTQAIGRGFAKRRTSHGDD
jgi:hypothetical protein